MVMGAALILSALLLLINNEKEASSAEQAVADLLPQLIQEIQLQQEEAGVNAGDLNVPAQLLQPSAFEMTEVEINGYGYIGYLNIPSIELELPVMSEWDYDRLKIPPCRYTGSVKGEDLVIMAHNYAMHFGQLKALSEGDEVIFVDMDGNVIHYEVKAKDILDPTAIEEITSGDFDLTLFTCTYGGAQRVTVYCDQVK